MTIGARAVKRGPLLAAASGLLSLLLGVSVYLLGRDWESVYFLAAFSTWQPEMSGWSGRVGFSLPSFFHAYGFAVLIILALGKIRRCALPGAAGWFAIAVLLEGLQSETAGSLFLTTQCSVSTSIFCRAVEAYVVHGSFDTADLMAAAIGCLAAGAVAYTLEVPR